ncbi:MAG: hypothetical protein O7H41_01435 [Planctomycetota bacterium]|nr:hypothetical protein [Planctomycetota bacterium]
MSDYNGRWRGKSVVFHCLAPDHPDLHPSIHFTPEPANSEMGLFICRACALRGNEIHLAKLIGITTTDFATPAPRPYRRTPAPPPEYPPAEEVKALWELCRPVCDDPAVSRWLQEERKIDPSMVETLDLARVLPVDIELPPWAVTRGGSWVAMGARLIVPMADVEGRTRSLRGRRLEVGALKELSPTGHAVSGLILADSLARLMLSGETLTDESDAADYVRDVGLIIVEGSIDFLATATKFSDANQNAPAVIGIVSGSWTREIAARVPTDTSIIIGTDPDMTGRRYRDLISGSLRDRCSDIRQIRKLVSEGAGL